MSKLLAIGGLVGALAAASADLDGPAVLDLSEAHSAAPAAAVRMTFPAEPGKAVRLSVYDSAETFLAAPRMKFEGAIREDGDAYLPLHGLEPGVYAFAAYLDENGDGILNRGKLLGRPKEPVAFSNGVKAKWERPRFDDVKVDVAPGSVVVITLGD
jgi:uncharacterized protein (DUF2141 family)